MHVYLSVVTIPSKDVELISVSLRINVIMGLVIILIDSKINPETSFT